MNSEVAGTGTSYSPLKRHHPDDQPVTMYKRRRLSPGRASRRHDPPTPSCSSDSGSSTSLPDRKAQAINFSQLIKRQNLHAMKHESKCLGWQCCGKKYLSFAVAIKKYTQEKGSGLAADEITLLIEASKRWKINPDWSGKSLTTIFHCLTTAGAFVSPAGMTSRTAKYQTRLLEELLSSIHIKSLTPANIDPLGVSFALSAMAKTVDQGIEITSLFEETAAVLLEYVIDHRHLFCAQSINHLLWALATLVRGGLEQPLLVSRTVMALLPFALNHSSGTLAREISSKLRSLVTLLEFHLEMTPELHHVLKKLIQSVKDQAQYLGMRHIVLQIQTLTKLLDREKTLSKEIIEAASKLLVYLVPAELTNHELATTLSTVVNVPEDVLPLTSQLRGALRGIVAHTTRRSSFKHDDITILTQSVVLLMERAPTLTPTLRAAAIPLLEQISAQRFYFHAREATELWCSQARLAHYCPELTPELKKSVPTLLLQSEWLSFHGRQIPPLFGALSALVSHDLLLAPRLAPLISKQLPVINSYKMRFGCQSLVDLFKSMSILVKHRLPLTPDLKVTIFELLTPINERHDDFTGQEIIQLLKSLTTLTNNGLELTQKHRQTVTALLPGLGQHIQADDAETLLWSLARLVSEGVEMTPTLERAVKKTLSAANLHQADFQPEQIVRVVWAVALFLGHRLPLTPMVKKVMVALVPRLDVKQINCSACNIASLLWALGSLGELIECPPAVLDDLARELTVHRNLTRGELYSALWGLLVCATRRPANCEAVQVSLYSLFTRAQAEPLGGHHESTTLAMAASWLGLQSLVPPLYQPAISREQSALYAQIRTKFPELKITQKVGINQLPPVDFYLPDQGTIIEVLASHHFVGHDFSTRNGSCLLKTRLYQKLGYEVIDIPANKFDDGQQEWLEHLLPVLKDKMSTRDTP